MVKWEEWTKHFLLRVDGQWRSQGKACVWCFSRQLDEPHFSWRTIVTGKYDCQKSFGYLFLEVWQTISKILTKQFVISQEKNWQYLLPMKNLRFKGKNWNLGKLGSSAMCLTVPLCLKTFLMTSVLILTNVTFRYYVMKCVNIWKTSITQWTNVFHVMWQNHAWVKSHLKHNTDQLSLI